MKRDVTTPGFRVEFTLGGKPQQLPWPPDAGTATRPNLERWRLQMNTSLKAGGSNHHLSLKAGVILHCGDVRLVKQSNNDVVAEVKQPMFEVI